MNRCIQKSPIYKINKKFGQISKILPISNIEGLFKNGSENSWVKCRKELIHETFNRASARLIIVL